MNSAYTYILECANGQYYVGSTKDLERRLQEHQAGIGGKFTKAHLPVKLVYTEQFQTLPGRMWFEVFTSADANADILLQSIKDVPQEVLTMEEYRQHTEWQ